MKTTLKFPLISALFFTMFIYFRPHLEACEIFVPQPGIEPVPPAVQVWRLNHWTAREIPDTNSGVKFLQEPTNVHILHLVVS